ncbi:MAG: hypothetical protein ACI9PY_000860 [Ascidiaceihabitans sp.]
MGLLQDHRSPCVIDFGAGHSLYSDQENLQKFTNAIGKNSNVFLLQPCENDNDAADILYERVVAHGGSTTKTSLLSELRQHASLPISKGDIHTSNITPNETASVILSKVR